MESDNKKAFNLVLEVFRGESSEGKKTVPPTAVAAATDYIVTNDVADQLATLLYPSGIPMNVTFYDPLNEWEKHLGHSELTSAFITEVGVLLLKRMQVDDRQKVLTALLNVAKARFWRALRLMPAFIEKLRFPPSFLIPWFFQVKAKLGNDLAQGDFWRAVTVWSLKHPEDSLIGIKLTLDSALDDDKISFAAAILGNLRVVWESKAKNEEGRRLEAVLLGHIDVHRRLVFHRSWINTGWQRELTTNEFSRCLERMSAGTEEEHAEAFNFLRCLLTREAVTPDHLRRGVEWLTANTNSSISDTSKLWVVTIAQSVTQRKEIEKSIFGGCWKALIAIQPIPPKTAGIWQNLEALFVDVLQRDAKMFEELLLNHLAINPDGIIHLFTEPQTFEWLLAEMQARTQPGFYGSLFFSPERNQRRFAFVLYDELPFHAFPDGLLEKRSDDEIALALLAFRLNRLSPENVPGFSLLFLARMENADGTLKHLYEEELLYQSKNFPRACLSKLKLFADKSALVRLTITKAEAYFDALQKCQSAALKAMEIPGLNRAFQIQQARQSRQIHQMSQEISVFAKLFATSYLIYGGKTCRQCNDGVISEITELQTYSTEAELPRLEMIDPEGAVLRRHQAMDSIRQLKAKMIEERSRNDS